MRSSIVNFIDADTILFLIAYNLQDTEDVDICIANTNTFVKAILDRTNSHYYLGFLGGNGNFRKELSPLYKAKRAERPEYMIKWELVIRRILIEEWKFVVVDNIESEDAVIICANAYCDKTNVIISHTDKDLNFWWGNHYHYQKHQHWYTDELGELYRTKTTLKGKGLKFFYAQLLMGDKGTDGVEGLRGYGPVKILKLIDSCTNEYSLFRRVYTAYLRESTKEQFILTWKLIRMLDYPSYSFEIPELIKYSRNNIEDLF